MQTNQSDVLIYISCNFSRKIFSIGRSKADAKGALALLV